MAITAPTPQTMVDAIVWGKPITDAVNLNTTDIASLKTATTPSVWTALTLTAPWVNLVTGHQVMEIRKIGDIVYVRGTATGGSSGTQLFVLSAGFRPPAILRFNSPDGKVDVNANGSVVVYRAAGDPTSSPMSVNISFSIL